MKRYISKDVLKEKIENRIKETESMRSTNDPFWEGQISAFDSVLKILDTLETKEVDLDLEITLWANAIPETRLDDIERLAKYFYELGLKTKVE